VLRACVLTTSARRGLFVALAMYFFAGVPRQARAASVDLTVSKPLGDGEIVFVVTNAGVSQTTVVPITGNLSATQKRTQIVVALTAKGYNVGFKSTTLTVKDLTPGTMVSVISQETGENNDMLTAPAASGGGYAFTGIFSPDDPLGHLSTFTAGFTTNLGTVSATVDSSQVTGLSGRTITSDLFCLLAPVTPSIGVDLSLGSRIFADFDPRTTMDGVEFGSTSGTGSVSGFIQTVPEPWLPPVAALLISAFFIKAAYPRLRN
jgi:hypothetical protein